MTEAPKVKPAEWLDVHGDGSKFLSTALTPITRKANGEFFYFGETYPNLDAAKAAAQPGWEAFILSVLDLSRDGSAQGAAAHMLEWHDDLTGYLDRMQRYWAPRGVVLTDPEALKYAKAA
jgi:hypothetical protein